MEAVGNPKLWVPYMSTNKDCTRRFCSPVTAFSPPPTVASSENATKLPPFLVTIFGVLFTGLLLVTYFAVVSKFCRKKIAERHSNVDEEMQNQLPAEGGLDESFIKSIVTYEYKKDDGLVKRVDCAVCLGEFQENERLRILPKCTHSFHLQCIDVWLKSHSTCPLCRVSLTCTSSAWVAAPLNTA